MKRASQEETIPTVTLLFNAYVACSKEEDADGFYKSKMGFCVALPTNSLETLTSFITSKLPEIEDLLETSYSKFNHVKIRNVTGELGSVSHVPIYLSGSMPVACLQLNQTLKLTFRPRLWMYKTPTEMVDDQKAQEAVEHLKN